MQDIKEKKTRAEDRRTAVAVEVLDGNNTPTNVSEAGFDPLVVVVCRVCLRIVCVCVSVFILSLHRLHCPGDQREDAMQQDAF